MLPKRFELDSFQRRNISECSREAKWVSVRSVTSLKKAMLIPMPSFTQQCIGKSSLPSLWLVVSLRHSTKTGKEFWAHHTIAVRFLFVFPPSNQSWRKRDLLILRWAGFLFCWQGIPCSRQAICCHPRRYLTGLSRWLSAEIPEDCRRVTN